MNVDRATLEAEYARVQEAQRCEADTAKAVAVAAYSKYAETVEALVPLIEQAALLSDKREYSLKVQYQELIQACAEQQLVFGMLGQMLPGLQLSAAPGTSMAAAQVVAQSPFASALSGFGAAPSVAGSQNMLLPRPNG